MKPYTPMCAFCWPKLKVSETIDLPTKLPCCLGCAGENKTPRVPKFHWADLRLAAMWAFAHQT